MFESARVRTPKSTPIKKSTEKTNRTTTEKSSTSQSTNSFIDSLKRVQGALSPGSKTKSASKDVKKNRPLTETPTKTTIDKFKDKDKDRARAREKDKEKERRPWFRSPSRSSTKKEIKSSSTSLNAITGQRVATQDIRRRPVSEINVTYRRGQATKLEGNNIPDNLSRTSSVTNLDADPKNGKGARPRKTSSREKIDRIVGDGRKNDKKRINKNNNKLDIGDDPHYSVESFSEEELTLLRKQLQEMAQEKTNLALQLGEQKGQLNILQKEIQKLKEESNMQLEHLTEENTTLRNRLRDVALSPLSDNEKQQLLFDSQRHHSSAPASIATNIDDGNGAETTCNTPDWDKHSSSNVSEVSVACLQDKINQMQETHYSTNEELQATLQELTDLQRQLTELQQENERLNEEKSLMFDSLCRQTERLNDSRSEVESLKQLLYQEKDDTGQFETAVEREQKLVDLLKSAQEEREGLLVKLEQLNNELQETSSGIIEKEDQIGHLRERVKTLECTLDAKHAEHKLLDQELAQAKDQCSGKQIEINRLTDLLDNARTKIIELEQDRTLSDKSELDELLDNARKEKDALESEVAHLKEQLAISKNEIEKLKEQISILQEECKVTRNNAKTTQSDLEYKCEKLIKDKNVLNEQLQEFQEALNELQVQSQCQLEDKRQLSAVLSETQRNLSEAERKNLALENEVDELKRLRNEENEEWEKFQDDLLTSVRVANDFKTEAQQELQRMILENKSYRDRERQLRAEIEKLKGGSLKSEDKENMDLLVKRPNKNRNKTGTLSNASRSDSQQSLTVKRRENKSLKSKRLKTLSVEEEMLLNSLDNYHKDIDKNLPDEFLTEEEKVIRKLKIIYEDDYLKVKPVAPKPKDQLAISKPLLDSVLSNPKLMAIIKNPEVKTIEDMATFEKEAPEIRNLIQDIDRSKKGKSEDCTRPQYTKRISIIGRSMSVNHLNDIDYSERSLYRSNESEDLTSELPLRFHRRDSSSLVPSDSASNYKRYSDFSIVVNKDLNIFNDTVKYSTLERIVKTIPKNAPETTLTKEQKFAMKLLQALEERKNTLKKSEKAKTLPISEPTPDSVLKNPKLKEIIYNPDMEDVRRKSEPFDPPEPVKVMRASKSYENIVFSFEDKSHSVKVYESHSESSETLTSAEFNVETGETGPYEPLSKWVKPKGTPLIPKKDLIKRSKSNEIDEIIKGGKTGILSSPKAILLKNELAQLSQPLQFNISKDSPLVEEESNRAEEDKKNSLLYNETLNKKEKSFQLDKSYKVDLLQEKIKKIKNEQPDHKLIIHIKDQTNPNEEKTTLILHVASEETIPPPIKETTPPPIIETVPPPTVESTPPLIIETVPPPIEESAPPLIIETVPPPTVESTPPSIIETVPSPTEESKPPSVEETDSLYYNDTLTKAAHKKSPKTEDDTALVDETIKNITSKLQEIKKLISDDEPIQVNLEEVSFNKQPEAAKNEHSAPDNLILESVPAAKNKDDFEQIEESKPNENDSNKNNLVQVEDSKLNPDFNNSLLETESNDEDTKQPDYDYHAILKENRVGVTSPLNYRLSYKDVVNEIKNRFSGSDFVEEINDVNKHNKDIDELKEELTIKEITTEPKNIEDDDVSIRERSKSIDKEMEDILENYLHTRVSQLIKETISKPAKTSDAADYNDFDKKLNDIVQMKIDSAELEAKSIDKTMSTEKVKIEEPKTSKNDKPKPPTELKFSDDSYFEMRNGEVKRTRAEWEQPNIAVRDVIERFIADQRKISELYNESVRKVHTNVSWDSILPKKRESVNIDYINDEINKPTSINRSLDNIQTVQVPLEHNEKLDVPDLIKTSSVSTKEELAEVLPDNEINVETSDINNEVTKTESEAEKLPIKKISIQQLSESNLLSQEEIEIVKRSCNQKYPRPLSEFNEDDLELVQQISLNYMDETDSKDSQVDSIKSKEIVQEDVKKRAAEPNQEVVHKKVEKDKVDDLENLLTEMSTKKRIKKISRLSDKNEAPETSKDLNKTDEVVIREKEDDLPHSLTRDLHVVLHRNNKSNRGDTRSLILPESNEKIVNKNRLSADLSPKPQVEKKKVKSFAQHFERLSLQRSKFTTRKVEPIRTQNAKLAPSGDKKPIPKPRRKNQGTKDVSDGSVSKGELKKMSECGENFSVDDRGNSEGDAGVGGFMKHKDKVGADGLNEIQNLGLDDYTSLSDDEDEDGSGSVRSRLNSQDIEFEATVSMSAIAVAGTAEKLDVRKQSTITVEPSCLNLFNPDESIQEDNFSYHKKKKLGLGYLELNEVDSFEDILEPTDSKPKIVDFVPLDEATKPYYKNNHMQDYSTLEREKTYQVMNAVSSKEKVADDADEFKNKYTAAKKMFQDLETKSDNSGVKMVTVSKKKSKENTNIVDSENNKLGIKIAPEINQ